MVSGYTIIASGVSGFSEMDNRRRIHVEVLLLDETEHNLRSPHLYQLPSEKSYVSVCSDFSSFYSNHEKETLVMMGRMQEWNKNDKLFILENGDIVTYNYLIIAKGATHTFVAHNEEGNVRDAIGHLSEAIKIQHVLSSAEKMVQHPHPSKFFPKKIPSFTIVDENHLSNACKVEALQQEIAQKVPSEQKGWAHSPEITYQVSLP
jgi:NADH dehydrogenase FAD-containing subunit